MSGDAATDPLAYLTGLGPVGVFLVLFLMGKIHTDSEVKRLEIEIARLQKQNDALQASVMEQAIPVLTRVTDLMPDLIRTLRERSS